jgi:osmotically-inducible protein OsmY
MMRNAIAGRMAAAILLSLAVFMSAGQAQNKNVSRSSKPATVDCSKTDDATITANVKERLAKRYWLKFSDLNVETKNGIVTLTGNATASSKSLAARHAKLVPCVKSVTNNLQVKRIPKCKAGCTAFPGVCCCPGDPCFNGNSSVPKKPKP